MKGKKIKELIKRAINIEAVVLSNTNCAWIRVGDSIV
jgi:hypothetical protein